MSTATSFIEWTDRTWNPVRGCTRISPGCEHCYAERTAARFSGPGKPYDGLVRLGPNGPRWTGKVRLVPSALADVLSWRRPVRVFVNSMSDLFHEGLADEDIAAVFGVMAACPHLTFQVLTKRAERMARWFELMAKRGEGGMPLHLDVRGYACQALSIAGEEVPASLRRVGHEGWPLRNVWLGVSVEDQQRADERIPHLLRTPAAVRFLSCEPLLGPVSIADYMPPARRVGCGSPDDPCDHSLANDQAAVRWVIVGGESGPGSRPFDLGWARSLVEQCRSADVACFVKQLGRELTGEWHPAVGKILTPPRLGDLKGGNPDEWPEDLRVREWPAVRP